MKPSTKALIWEQWRLTRPALPWAAILVGLSVTMISAAPSGEFIRWLGFLFLSLSGLLLAAIPTDGLAVSFEGFSRRTFTLPVRSVRLALTALLFRAALFESAIVLFCVAEAAYRGLHLSMLTVMLAGAGFYLCIQSLVWSLRPASSISAVVLSAMFLVAEPAWFGPASAIAPSAVLVPLMLRSVAKSRYAARKLADDDLSESELLPAPRRFKSKEAALLWREWGEVGVIAPAAVYLLQVLLVVFLGSGGNSRGGAATVALALTVLLLSSVCFSAQLNQSRKQGDRFTFLRPVRCQEIAHARLKFGAMLLIAPSVIALACIARSETQLSSLDFSLVAVLLALGAWTCFWIREVVVYGILVAGCFLLMIPFMAQLRAVVFVAASLTVVGAAYGFAYRKTLVSGSTVVLAAACWLLVAAVHMVVNPLELAPPELTSAAGFLVLPFAPFATLPLRLDARRHGGRRAR